MKTIAAIIYILFPTIIILFLLFSTDAILSLWKNFSKRGKRSPLKNYKLWRSPGESLRERIEDHTLDITMLLVAMPLSIFLFTPMYFSQLYGLSKGKDIYSTIIVTIGINVFLILLCVWRIVKTWSSKHKLQLGLDGETYVGQQLNHLMLLGCRVYHDFQTDKQGNIDHIVVSSAGVFAVETKGKYKPDKRRGKIDANVVFDGKNLKFSDVFQTNQPLKQATGTALTLSKWLSSAVGGSIPVTPVVALPGWYIELKALPKEVKIINGKIVDDTGQVDIEKVKRSIFFNGPRGQDSLGQEMFSRIVHQLDQKCRNVEPCAYQQAKNT